MNFICVVSSCCLRLLVSVAFVMCALSFVPCVGSIAICIYIYYMCVLLLGANALATLEGLPSNAEIWLRPVSVEQLMS